MAEVRLEESDGKYYSIVTGNTFDLEKKSVLSYRNKDFRSQQENLILGHKISLVDYMISAKVLKYEWNNDGDYVELEYETKNGEKKQVYGNKGLTPILRNIAKGTYDPNEVLADFCVQFITFYHMDSNTKKEIKEQEIDKYNKILENLKEEGLELKIKLTKQDYEEIKKSFN